MNDKRPPNIPTLCASPLHGAGLNGMILREQDSIQWILSATLSAVFASHLLGNLPASSS